MKDLSTIFNLFKLDYEYYVPDQFEESALDAVDDLKMALGVREYSDPELLKLMVMAANVGIASKNGQMNRDEAWLCRLVFEKLQEEHYEQVEKSICCCVSENTYEQLKEIAEQGNDIAIPFLHLVMSFAYVDGEMDEEVAERIKTIFAKNLLDQYYGRDEKMAIDVARYEELAPLIFSSLKKSGELKTIEQLRTGFPGFTEKEVESTLCGLCRQGYIFKIKSIMGITYGVY